MESIDETVQPCENFFEFACGKWLKSHRIPEDGKSKKQIFSITPAVSHIQEIGDAHRQQ